MRAAVIAPGLASVAGFVDAVGYITLHGLFVAHMSGNSVKFAVFAGKGNLAAAAPASVAIALFVTGVALGTVTAELASRRRVRSIAAMVLTIQTALIAAFMVYGATLLSGDRVVGRSLSGFYVLAGVAAVAMGLQTSALRQFGGQTIRTTYVTGVITSLMQESANYLFWLHDGKARDVERSFLSRVLGLGSRAESRGAVLLLGAVWLAYIGGGLLGSFSDGRIKLWSLLIPLAVLLAVIVEDLRRPITS